MNKLTIEQRLQDIHAECFPAADEMPDDALARCEWYARRLCVIANAATAALQHAERNNINLQA